MQAGFLYIPPIIKFLRSVLVKSGIKIYENSEVADIKKNTLAYSCLVNGKFITSPKVVITVGAWSCQFLRKINKSLFNFIPIVPIQQTLDYFAIPDNLRAKFSSPNMPVFAYLDVGIYGHPLYKKTPGLKVAYFDPHGAKLVKSQFNPARQELINNNRDFIRRCLPDIKEIKVVETEQNYYDMTPDNNFVIGEVPGNSNMYLAGGFCGTGFKFAPIVGRNLAELIYRKKTEFDIRRFSPFRFSRLTDLSFIKTLPMYTNYLFPRNWKYLTVGIKTLLNLNQLP